MHDTHLTDEPARMAALGRLCVLDTSPEEQFDKITALVRTVLCVPIATVTLVDAERQWFKSRQGLEASETPRDISFCTHTIRRRDSLNIGDALVDERFRTSPLVTQAPYFRAYLGAPLKTADGYNVGALCAIDVRPRSFTPAEERMLAAFAALVVDEFELRLLAGQDALTGVMTRRAFLSMVDGVVGRLDQRPATFAMLDIDHFKSVNDRFGHPRGDEVLQQVAEACRVQLGDSGIIGRLGGEEFGILFKDLGLKRAFAEAERLRDAIAALTFSFEPALRVTASFGLYDLENCDANTAIAGADTALYIAKREGRNRCVAIESVMQAA